MARISAYCLPLLLFSISAHTEDSTEVGMTMFRGNAHRSSSGKGQVARRVQDVKLSWKTRALGGGREFSGVGWTGQPLVVRWPLKYRKLMRWNPFFAKSFGPEEEVIIGTGSGRIYFFDFATGRDTRPSFSVSGQPIKGTVAVHPEGWPYLVFGQGLPWETNANGQRRPQPTGLHIVDLVKMKDVFFIDGSRGQPPRRWPAFDSSVLFVPEKDQLLALGENGLFYKVDLHSDRLDEYPKIYPTVATFAQKKPYAKTIQHGFESSISYHGGVAFFTDNQGEFYAFDVEKMKVLYRRSLRDDTDATGVLAFENRKPYLYVGNEVDWRGARGAAQFFKINVRTGQAEWVSQMPDAKRRSSESRYTARSAGVLGTAALGTSIFADRMFISTAADTRDGHQRGYLMALDRATGRMLWRYPLNAHSWSSPAFSYDVWTQSGTVVIGDFSGHIHAVDARSGKRLWRAQLQGPIHGSPVIWKNQILVGTVGGRLYSIGTSEGPRTRLAGQLPP
ncbi:MAG: PQQ-binding-like beta-propeller repeat protein [Bdellovibrionales bacterium]